MSGLDPVNLRDPSSVLVARQMFDTLVSYDPQDLALQPRLAESWESEDGGARYIFHLRTGIRFHNGREIKADDVVFALNRLAAKQTHAELAFLLDQVVGFDDFNQKGSTSGLEGLRAIDPSTVEIRLKSRWVEFPYVLTNVATSPVPSESLQDLQSFKMQPVGSGPYRLEKPLNAGEDDRLVPFDGYWGSKPSIPSVELLIYDQMSSAWKDFTSGLLDVAQVPVDEVAAAKARYGTAGFTPLAAAQFLGINAVRVPEIRLRQAISAAIDRDAISRQTFAGVLTPSDSILPAALSPGSVPNCLSGCRPDIAVARNLVAQITPGPTSVTYDFQSTRRFEAAAVLIQRELASVNIAIEGRPLDLADLSNELNSSGAQMFNIGWVAEFPSAEWFLDPLLRSSSLDNHVGYKSQQIDAALDAAKIQEDPKSRLQMYQKIERMTLGDAVLIPIGQFTNRFVASSRIKGFYVDQTGGFSIQKMRVRAG